MTMPRVTGESWGIIPGVKEKDYLDLSIGDDGKEVLSASRIKKIITQDFKPPSPKSAELGSTVHTYLSKYHDKVKYSILGPFKGADGRALRANSKAVSYTHLTLPTKA